MDRMDVAHDLPGWRLVWYQLELQPGAAESADAARGATTLAARERLSGRNLVDFPVVAEVRRLFREAGTDPTRYRPSSEALLRRVLKGEELPAIHPLVDLNNCVSVALVVPSCVMAEGSFAPPVRLRRGRSGERMESLRGDFDLAGKPLLEDARGPFGTPITDSLRVAVEAQTERAWMVVYLPASVLAARDVDAQLAAPPLASIARWARAHESGDAA
ncbi:MAG TPA: phenylalanine--tRNA ligase beta subunit-related protein [Thermoanaerobaculia bacterium]|nr:phenylalanine--tRNA ligase beta subunit-related protein [Thermoanaerobaculia bacterium]